MSSFQFRLDGLLKLRRHREDAARQDLADAQRQVQQAQEHLAELAESSERASHAVSDRSVGQSVVALQAGYAHVHRLGELEAASREHLAELDQQRQERRAVAMDAQRARKTVERLYHRHLEQYLLDLRREDNKLTDETGTQLAATKAQQGRVREQAEDAA